MYSKEKLPGALYEPELWPQVSYLVISEMAKRAWSLYFSYDVTVILGLGLDPLFLKLQVEPPRPVDDQVSLFMNEI